MTNEEFENLQREIEALSEQLKQSQAQIFQLNQKLNAYKSNDIVEASTDKINIQSNVPITTQNKVSDVHQHSALENFIGLKIINVVGIVVLLIGLSIGVKYSIDKNLITPLTRIILSYTAVAGLFMLSIILKKKYEGFSAILFSGAMAAAYFTTYGAFTYYDLFSQTLCFVLMAVIAVYTAIGALQYNRQIIAIVGMVGAYAIPLLISSNQEKYILLFSYILVMNFGILLLAFKRSWKVLNFFALVFTWLYFISWLLLKYDASTDKLYSLVFVFIFYILFLLTNFIFKLRRNITLQDDQQAHIVINDFALYISLLSIFDTYSSSIKVSNISMACAIWFFVLAITGNQFFKNEKILNKLHYMEALILLVFVVSLRFSGLTITMSWTLIAILTFVLGVLYKSTWPRLAAIILIGFTLSKLVFVDSISFTAIQKIIAYITIGTLLLVLSFFYQKFKQVFFSDEKKSDN